MASRTLFTARFFTGVSILVTTHRPHRLHSNARIFLGSLMSIKPLRLRLSIVQHGVNHVIFEGLLLMSELSIQSDWS